MRAYQALLGGSARMSGGAARYWEGEMSGAATVVTSTYGSPDREAILPVYTSLAQQAYKGNGVVFGAIAKRIKLFSEAELKWQNKTTKKIFGNEALERLETPWPGGTTSELFARMEQDVSLAGNSFTWDATDQFVRLRPDWTIIVSELRQDPLGRWYRVPIGYMFEPPELERERWGDPQFFSVDEVAHWSPLPDPEASFRGMSWLTPVIREIEADSGMTGYKRQYLDNAATPNMIIKYPAGKQLRQDTLDILRDRMAARHGGVANAFKTLVLDQGADVTPVGNTFEQMNFTTVQAAGENRILIAAEVPGIVVGSKEGLMAATYSNYQQAMRSFADLWARPTWKSACACLAKFVTPPDRNSRLWYDVSGVSALRQGEKEQAETMATMAQAAALLVEKGGYSRESVSAALTAGDLSQLVAQLSEAPPVVVSPEAEIARNLVEMVQKVYLGVGTVITSEEARQLLNDAGAALAPGAPVAKPASAPVPPALNGTPALAKG